MKLSLRACTGKKAGARGLRKPEKPESLIETRLPNGKQAA
jgi:hypothetical protein